MGLSPERLNYLEDKYNEYKTYDDKYLSSETREVIKKNKNSKVSEMELHWFFNTYNITEPVRREVLDILNDLDNLQRLCPVRNDDYTSEMVIACLTLFVLYSRSKYKFDITLHQIWVDYGLDMSVYCEVVSRLCSFYRGLRRICSDRILEQYL